MTSDSHLIHREKHISIRRASKEPIQLPREHIENERQIGLDPFKELEFRFRGFKQQKYL